jgi:glycosyltransferase A (GT-A) superfamily protein (DUF2064 family)
LNKKTALLIFANSAEKEATLKPFQSSELLFDALNNHALKIAEKSGLDYFHFSEKNQIGRTFAQRFTNAIQSVYNKGYDTVITIGNDTPHLQTKHILKAEAYLQNNDFVFGPSKDGGFYLMGLKKLNFNRETFIKLPWQTSGLAKCFIKILKQNYKATYLLEFLSDIDTVSDTRKINDAFKSVSTEISILLKNYISIEKKILNYLFNAIENYTIQLHFNKGSPYLLHL